MSPSRSTPPSTIILRYLKPLALIAALACLASCSWSLSDISLKNLENEEDVTANISQIRLKMRSLVDPMSGEIERAADQIIQSTDEPGVKRAALEWKAQGVPAIREALFQPIPLTAAFDTWVLINQMTIFFDHGDGAKAMGPSASIAVSACLKMERDFSNVIASMTKSGDVSRARKDAREWAAQHPIDGAIAYRESTLTRAHEVKISDEFTAGDAIADITLTVDDLNRRIEIYSDQVVRQARWEAELLSMDLSNQLELDQALPTARDAVAGINDIGSSIGDVSDSIDLLARDLDQIIPILDRLTLVAESLPTVIAEERATTIKAAQDEITRAIKVVSEERQIALSHISAERLSALQHLHQMLAEERALITTDVEQISTRVVDHSFSRASQLIIVLLLAIVVILLVGLYLVRRMISGLMRENNEAPATKAGK